MGSLVQEGLIYVGGWIFASQDPIRANCQPVGGAAVIAKDVIFSANMSILDDRSFLRH